MEKKEKDRIIEACEIPLQTKTFTVVFILKNTISLPVVYLCTSTWIREVVLSACWTSLYCNTTMELNCIFSPSVSCGWLTEDNKQQLTLPLHLLVSQFIFYSVSVSSLVPVYHIIQHIHTHTYTHPSAPLTHKHRQFAFHTVAILSHLLFFCHLSLPLSVWFVLLWSLQHTIVLWFWASVPQQCGATSRGADTTNAVAYGDSETQRSRHRGEIDECRDYNIRIFFPPVTLLKEIGKKVKYNDIIWDNLKISIYLLSGILTSLPFFHSDPVQLIILRHTCVKTW